MEWLRETHKVSPGYKVAILHGNKDHPTMVELFARDSFSCKATFMAPDQYGNLVVVKQGEKPEEGIVDALTTPPL